MSTSTLIRKQGRPLWMQCLFASVVLHGIAGAYLCYEPLRMHHPLSSLFGLTLAQTKLFPGHEQTPILDKNALLEEVFETILVMPSHLHPPHDLTELPTGIALTPHEESPLLPSDLPVISTSLIAQAVPSTPKEVSDLTPLFDEELIVKEAILEEIQQGAPPALFQALEESARKSAEPVLFDPLSLELPLPTDPLALTPYPDLPDLPDVTAQLLPEPTQPLSPAAITSIAPSERAALTPSVGPLITQEKKTTLLIPEPTKSPLRAHQVNPSASNALASVPMPKIPATALWNDDFDVAVQVVPHPQGEGYLFGVTLTANHDLKAHKLQNNFYFILDRSSSSQRHRFNVFKRAALKALSSLQENDTFNIFVLDKHITALSPENLTASLANQRAAEDFLETQDSTRLFQNATVYGSLDKILEWIPDNAQMHTAILLTDGQGGLSDSKKRSLFNRWLKANDERVTLYTAAVGKDNDLIALDLLSSESGGRLLYSDTHASFPRKVAKLVLDLKAPLAKEIDIMVRPHDTHSYIELYPTASSLPPLFAQEPYQVLGEIDHLATFDLILEGRHKDDWIAIQKTISLDKMQSGDASLVKQWKKMQTSHCYAQFLAEGKSRHLEEAKEILKNTQKEIAFE